MGSTDGLIDNFVHQTQGFEAVGRDAHGLGGLRGFFAGFPQNRGTAFGADDRIHRVLQHQHLVRHRNGQGTARAAFANDGGDDGGFELRHLKDVAANGLRLATLLGIDTGESTGRIDKGEHGQFEFFCGFHQAQGFAVALRAGHAEVAQGALFGVAPFLVANHHAGLAIEAGQAADDGFIVGKVAITVHFHEIGKNFAHIVQGVRTIGMPGNFGNLPRCQVAVDIFGQLVAFFAQLIDFIRNIDGAFALHVAQLVNFGFQLCNGLLKVEESFFSQDFSPCPSAVALEHLLCLRPSGLNRPRAGGPASAKYTKLLLWPRVSTPRPPHGHRCG